MDYLTLQSKVGHEKKSAKSDLIVVSSEKAVNEKIRHGIKVELVEAPKKIEVNGLVGVEAYFRAWKGKKQLGFGKKGDVDIERIRIFNPPVLIPDELGLIPMDFIDEDGNVTVHKYTFDPKEALLDVIAHTASISGKQNTKVIQGKRGKTTSVFYPDASPETTSVDGMARRNDGVGDTWANIRGGAGNESNDSNTTQSTQLTSDETSGSWRLISRNFYLFDTSALPDTDTVNSATISFYITAVTDNFSQSLCVVTTNPASNTAIVTSDYANTTTTQQASDQTLASLTTSAYNDFALNATGISNVSKTGVTKFGTRLSGDRSNTEPTWSSTLDAFATIRQADNTGTTQDPKLTVNHSGAFTPKVIVY